MDVPLSQVSPELRQAIEAAAPSPDSRARRAHGKGRDGKCYAAVETNGMVGVDYTPAGNGFGQPVESEPDGVEWKPQTG